MVGNSEYSNWYDLDSNDMLYAYPSGSSAKNTVIPNALGVVNNPVPDIPNDVVDRLIKPDPVAQLRTAIKTNTQPNTVTTTLEVVPDPVVSRSVATTTKESFFSKYKIPIIVVSAILVLAISSFFVYRAID